MNNTQTEFATILNRVASANDRPSKSDLITALQAAETNTRTNKESIDFTKLLGEWRFCFATGASKYKSGGTRIGSGYYVPKFIRATITFSGSEEPNLGTVTNQLSVGTVYIRFSGPCRYPGKRNLLVFDFTEVEFRILGIKVYQGQIRSGKNGSKNFTDIATAKLPFFAFFWAGDRSIAARGRSGGLAVWVKN